MHTEPLRFWWPAGLSGMMRLLPLGASIVTLSLTSHHALVLPALYNAEGTSDLAVLGFRPPGLLRYKI